jgi:hypothetical protein
VTEVTIKQRRFEQAFPCYALGQPVKLKRVVWCLGDDGSTPTGATRMGWIVEEAGGSMVSALWSRSLVRGRERGRVVLSSAEVVVRAVVAGFLWLCDAAASFIRRRMW